MKKTEEKIRKVYEYVESYVQENGFPPSVREIQGKLSIKSTATVYDYLERLKSMGLITKTAAKNRAIGIPSHAGGMQMVPVVGEVAAGKPIFAVENLEGYSPLPEGFSGYEDVFILRVKGSSMIKMGIFNNDRIIVKKQETAENGEVVVALTDGENATVKRFYRRDGKIVLHPENDEMSDMVFEDVQIIGKVLGSIRKFV